MSDLIMSSFRSYFALAALVIIGSLTNVYADDTAVSTKDFQEMKQEMQKLKQRMQELEKRNSELEQNNNANVDKALESPIISADEPQVASRIKSVESQVNHQKKASELAESLENIKVTAGLTTVAQGLSGGNFNSAGNELNYRGDATVSVPMGSLGNSSDSLLFTHFRMGQGRGLQAPGTAFSGVNSTSFQRPGTEASDSTVLLAEAWYQVTQPLPISGNPALSRQHLEFNFGKMDPFAFFDKNAVANDETSRFMNQSLVHNPLLDTGGDIGVDRFGFTPGVRFAYVNETMKPQTYTVSLGVFGAGKGAAYDHSLQEPLTILQVETTQHYFEGLAGTYRLYGWHNALGQNVDGSASAHEGIGLSLDQGVDDYVTMFVRAGYQLRGQVRFDRTLTVGAEIGGSYWNRGADGLGVAVGLLQVSDDFKRLSPTVDANGDGMPDFGYQASGGEHIFELYYRYFLNKQLALSPSLQYIQRPGGDGNADSFYALGVRAQMNY